MPLRRINVGQGGIRLATKRWEQRQRGEAGAHGSGLIGEFGDGFPPDPTTESMREEFRSPRSASGRRWVLDPCRPRVSISDLVGRRSDRHWGTCSAAGDGTRNDGGVSAADLERGMADLSRGMYARRMGSGEGLRWWGGDQGLDEAARMRGHGHSAARWHAGAGCGEQPTHGRKVNGEEEDGEEEEEERWRMKRKKMEKVYPSRAPGRAMLSLTGSPKGDVTPHGLPEGRCTLHGLLKRGGD